jgi:hypothetical protein
MLVDRSPPLTHILVAYHVWALKNLRVTQSLCWHIQALSCQRACVITPTQKSPYYAFQVQAPNILLRPLEP